MLIIANIVKQIKKNPVYPNVFSFHDNICGVKNVVEDLTRWLLGRNPAKGQSSTLPSTRGELDYKSAISTTTRPRCPLPGLRLVLK